MENGESYFRQPNRCQIPLAHRGESKLTRWIFFHRHWTQHNYMKFFSFLRSEALPTVLDLQLLEALLDVFGTNFVERCSKFLGRRAWIGH